MKLYNTLTRQIETFTPLNPPKVGLYACGLTVYDYTHLGHLRKYSMDDVLIRTLRHAGYEVDFIQNVTDVGHLASDADTGEDKLEKGAKKYNESVWNVAKRFEDYFFKSMDMMGNLRPDTSCRATDHIPEQLKMVLDLEKKGFTYVIEGDGVYFDTSKLPDYGKLARLKKESLKEGARLGKVSGKKNPTDFALWKFEREGENRAMIWESPWHKRSFPGWHIECSAMAIKYLGPQFDIHTGGIDHIPVHHTNEIAQAETATGKSPFVRYWVHHNFLRVEGEKMSKSLDNFFTIDDIIERGFNPKALRLLFLTSHYRSELNFTWEALTAAQKGYEKLFLFAQGKFLQQDQKKLSPEALGLKEKFFKFLEDDLKTPEAVAVLWEVVKSSLADEEKQVLVKEFDNVLGLGLFEVGSQLDKNESEIPSEVKEKLAQREKAREDKDWKKADKIRDEIKELGWEVQDGGGGQRVTHSRSSLNEK